MTSNRKSIRMQKMYTLSLFYLSKLILIIQCWYFSVCSIYSFLQIPFTRIICTYLIVNYYFYYSYHFLLKAQHNMKLSSLPWNYYKTVFKMDMKVLPCICKVKEQRLEYFSFLFYNRVPVFYKQHLIHNLSSKGITNKGRKRKLNYIMRLFESFGYLSHLFSFVY